MGEERGMGEGKGEGEAKLRGSQGPGARASRMSREERAKGGLQRQRGRKGQMHAHTAPLPNP